jgi:pantoate--beta-alanine ligase|tara:strand:+ start:1902 stop:2711 length:810 start_codon:yes stop_codon:yes gene_type:complete
MKIILDKTKLIKLLNKEKNIGFVPTMGAIHKGHISLIKKSINQNKKTIVSIFINKPQFNKKNDFKKYPRVLGKDKKILKKLNVDYIFIPTEKQIYPKGVNKNIKINNFKKELCGKNRPNHFEAVVDVIQRFIKIINPKRIYLGKKDMQQLILVEDYLKRYKIKTQVIGCETVRQKNGVAFSSRNLLLSNNDQEIASKIYKILKTSKKNILKKRFKLILLKNKILNLGVKKIDYLKILDINKIIKRNKKKCNKKIFIAYYINSVRLIDNI